MTASFYRPCFQEFTACWHRQRACTPLGCIRQPFSYYERISKRTMRTIVYALVIVASATIARALTNVGYWFMRISDVYVSRFDGAIGA